MKKLVVLISLLFSSEVSATVLVERSYHTYTCSGAATYAIDFPVLEKSHVVVTRWLTAAPAVVTTLVQDGASSPSYTVTLYNGGASGLVTLTNGTTCATNYTLKVSRVIPITQTISFRSQGTFLPRNHEYMGDKLTMIIQQLGAGVIQSQETADALALHIGSSDDHSAYFKLAGRIAGQTASGGTLNGTNLVLKSSSAGTLTHGWISMYGGAGVMRLGNSSAPAAPELQLDAHIRVADTFEVEAQNFMATNGIRGSDDAGGKLNLQGTSHGSPGEVILGVAAELTVDESNSRVGVNDSTPDTELDVIGRSYISDGLCIGCESLPAGYALKLDEIDSGGSGLYATGAIFTASFLATHDGLYGGDDTEASKDFFVSSTYNATKGRILFGDTLSTTWAGVNESDGSIFGMRKVMVKSDSYSMSAPDDCNSVIFVDTSGKTITLPTISEGNSDGCQVTIVNVQADGAGGVKVLPEATEYTVGICVGDVGGGAGAATAWALEGAAGDGFINLTADHYRGDTVTFVNDGTATWYAMTCTGEWSSGK